MVSLPVHNQQGQQVGTYEIDPAELSSEVNKQLLHDAVVMYQTNRRQGTFRTKSRGEVAGNKKKMFRQKGTGNARMGSKRTNLRRGGGHAHAKRNIDYTFRMPRKAVRLATRMAVRSKIDDQQIVVLDQLAMQGVGTRQIASMLKALGLAETSCLLVTPEYDSVVYLSSRNIGGIMVSPACELNAYSVLRYKRMVVTREALDRLRKSNASAAE
jgi:large subunit ribosomal protein L4